MEHFLTITLALLPLLGGVVLAAVRPKRAETSRILMLGVLIAEALLSVPFLMTQGTPVTLLSLTPALSLSLRADTVGKLFAALAVFGFLLAGIFATRYLAFSGKENSFYAFLLLSQGALLGMDLAANPLTMLLFFVSASLLSVPLVRFEGTPEANHAAKEYLLHSVLGALLALGGILVISGFCREPGFTEGGSLDSAAAAGHETALQIAVFLGVIGFCAKAGMYPQHSWLPTAHPVAPGPASAVLSGVLAKAGVLAPLRLIYFTVGADFLRGTWVQYVLLALAVITVFMGSMMAYQEPLLKRRLAYSSVSQISYILCGVFLLTPQGLLGGLLHTLFHAAIKLCLFLTVGSFMMVGKAHRVEELRGVGRQMPLTLGAFTLAALALIGIPPASGFVSKWYLALGALDSGLPVFSWLVPVTLLLSALLTAGYLLPITIDGFFSPREEAPAQPAGEGGAKLLVPILIAAALTLLLGVFSGPLVRLFTEATASLF